MENRKCALSESGAAFSKALTDARPLYQIYQMTLLPGKFLIGIPAFNFYQNRIYHSKRGKCADSRETDVISSTLLKLKILDALW